MQLDIPTTGYSPHVQAWMDWILGAHDDAGLEAQLHEDVVFKSPVVHTPQRGKAITFAYLSAAGGTLGNDSFKYTRIFDCGDKAVLEFETQMDSIEVNGVDLIEWAPDGRIIEFKVMVRPLKAMQAVHAAMGRQLAAMKAAASA